MVKRYAPVLCEATSCALVGRHAQHCTDDAACRGCQPRQAADGLRLCASDAQRIAEDALAAPPLHDALAKVLISTNARRDGARTSGGAPVPDEDVMAARETIRRVLLRAARLVIVERGVAMPSVRRAGRRYALTQPHALAQLVARHHLWLAAHPSAGTVADDLRYAVSGRVRMLAFPHGRDRLFIGECPRPVPDNSGAEVPCGARLYQAADQPLVTCPHCGTAETIEQWQRWIVGEARGATDAYALAAHLSLLWMRDVDASLIRQWAHRCHIEPLRDEAGEPVRDHRGRTLYEVAHVVAYATAQWGSPYRVSSS